MAKTTTPDIDEMRSQWTELYSKTLPALARARDTAQPKWPVTLDHCFARIILDNTVGRGLSQWDNVIKKPAVRNMDAEQLKEAIELAERIKDGEVDLVALDQQSLRARGKGEKKYGDLRQEKEKKVDQSMSKRAREDGDDGEAEEKKDSLSNKKPKKQANNTKNSSGKQATLTFSKPSSKPDNDGRDTQAQNNNNNNSTPSGTTPYPNPNTPNLLLKISTHPTLTPYRKRLYSTLLSVPSGSYTTYASMASYLSSSARAVGSGMRNNPFAPDVPCHRVLAADGSIGGFFGDWGPEGKYAGEKRELLGKEGVKFDSRGKVKGPVYGNLRDMREVVGGEERCCEYARGG